MTLSEFNALTDAAAHELLLTICHSPVWADAVSAARPYAGLTELADSVALHWQAVDDTERLAAFAAHPLIGDVEHLRQKFARQAQSEQGQVLAASESTLQTLAELNQAYLDKFGFIFIICATGKSADEMLQHLRARIDNSRAEEIANAAREQAQITALRLAQAITEEPS